MTTRTPFHRRSLLVACTVLAFLHSPAGAQLPTDARSWADSARKAIETSYLSGNVEGLIAARALTERALVRFPDDPWLQHYRGYALYRESTLRRGRNNENVEELVEQGVAALDASAGKLKLPESHALLSSLIGQQIGSNPMKAMTLGPRSGQKMEEAVAMGENNPRVWLMRGVGAMFTPEMWGGGLDKAEEYIRRAITKIPGDKPQAPYPAWGHDEAWAWLGQVLQQKGKKDDARAAYQKALEIEPRNDWVRLTLLPALEKGR